MLDTTDAYDAALENSVRVPKRRVLVAWFGSDLDDRRERFPVPGFEGVSTGGNSTAGFTAGPIVGTTSYLLTQPFVADASFGGDDPHAGDQFLAAPGSFESGNGHASVLFTDLISGAVYKATAWVLCESDQDALEWGDLFGDRVSTSTTGAYEFLTVDLTAPEKAVRVGLVIPFGAAGGGGGAIDDVSLKAVIDARDDLTRYVTEISVDRSISGDLPESATLLAGYSSARALITLSGDPDDESRTGRVLWSPYSTASEYFGKAVEGLPVRVELGYETADEDDDGLLTSFVGRATDKTLRAGDDTAQIEALDNRERMRGRVSLPVVVADDGDTRRGGLNAQWVVDQVARSAGYYASPPPRVRPSPVLTGLDVDLPDTILSATLHGSAEPEIGTLIAARYRRSDLIDIAFTGEFVDAGQVIPYAQGNFALAPAPATNRHFKLEYGLSESIFPRRLFHRILVEGWVRVPESPGPLLGGDAEFRLTPSTDDQGMIIAVIRGTDSTTIGVTAGGASGADNSQFVFPDDGSGPSGQTVLPGWHYVAAMFAFAASTATAAVRVDGISHEATFDSVGQLTLDEYTLKLTAVTPVEAVMVSTVLDTGAEELPGIPDSEHVNINWADTFTPNAELEPSLLSLDAIPAISGDTDQWGLLQQIAGAEYATLTITADDRLRYWNRRHWRQSTAANTSVAELTSTSDILDVQTSELAYRIRNRITATATPLTVGDFEVVWDARQSLRTKRVDPLGTKTILASFGGDQVFDVVTDTHIIPGGGAFNDTQDPPRSGYRAARRSDGTGGAVENLTMIVTPISGSLVKIEISNPNGYPVFLVSPAGDTYPDASDGVVVVQLVGRRISSRPSGTTDGQDAADDQQFTMSAEATHDGSIEAFGEQLLALQPSPWLQHGEDAQSLVSDLLRALYRPVPQVGPVDIVPRPELELGDRITLTDTSGTELSDPFWIVGDSRRYSASDMTQSLTLRPVAAVGQWILGVTGRTELGITTNL